VTTPTDGARPGPRVPDGHGSAAVGVAAAAALAGEYADALVLGTVRDRVFTVTGRATAGTSTLPRLVHDGITAGVYAGVGAGLKAATAGLRAAERRGVGPRLQARSSGRQVVSAVNGLIGDRLRDERPELAIEMAVRRDGCDVPLDTDSLTEAFPAATGNVVVFLHGLGENEESWNLRRDERGGTYGSRLASATDWTPVYLRANTGLPLRDNGTALASLMSALLNAWPREVRRIALVGHSMGGLIARAACAIDGDASASGERWTDLVTDVVTLGTPHLGAPLEHLVHAGAAALGVFPESAPFGRILDHRSVGILDLRRGLPADVRRLPTARYRLVAATLGPTPSHPVSEVFGDLLVRYPSATGQPRRGSPVFPDADVLHVRGGHFSLLNHPDVHRALKSWLD
jgi:pimeloyl-ACP methyl ester carboxylesterase